MCVLGSTKFLLINCTICFFFSSTILRRWSVVRANSPLERISFAISFVSFVLKCFVNFSLAALEPLLASEYISSEISILEKSVLLPVLYSNAGSGFTKISNLSPSIERRTVLYLASTISCNRSLFVINFVHNLILGQKGYLSY